VVIEIGFAKGLSLQAHENSFARLVMATRPGA